MDYKIISNTANIPKDQIENIVNWLRLYRRKTKQLSGREEPFVLNLGDKNFHLKIASIGGILSNLPFFLRARLGLRKLVFEQRALQLANKFGIQAPKFSGNLILSIKLLKVGFIVTDFIPGVTLAELSKADPEKAKLAFKNLEVQINKMLASHLYHKDLHPGNILVTSENDVYILDWASVVPSFKPRSELLTLYITRWRRACIKYNLSDFLISYFCKIVGKLPTDESLY